MNKKYCLLVALAFIFQGCNSYITSDNSSNNISESSNVNNSSSLDESSSQNNNSSISDAISSSEVISNEESAPSIEDSSSEKNSSSIEDSTSEESSSSSDASNTPSKEDEYSIYRSQVDRSKIVYSTPIVNDETHKVRRLEVFQINDTHGAYNEKKGDNGSEKVGINRVKTCINENTDDIYAQVKIANGDMLQGSAFSNLLLGEPAIASLNEMNFDCFVIGNHEFDWGIEKLRIYKDGDLSNGELNCPFLGANIVDRNNERPSFIEPYTIVNKGDMEVGIIGVIGDGHEDTISKISLGDYHFTSTEEAVKKYSEELLNKNVDTIIVASHAHDEKVNEKYTTNLKVDCIINAHDHQDVNYTIKREDGKYVPVIESRTKNITMGKVVLNYDENKNYLNSSISHFYPSDYDEDEALKNIMNVYYEVLKDYIETVIGNKANGFSKEEIATTTCTYIANKYKADLVFVNTGGVRSAVKSSSITKESVFEVFPFDNELYEISIKGNILKKMISNKYMTNYFYNNSNIGLGTTYDFNNIDVNKLYKVMTVDYVATKDYMESYFSPSYNLIKTGCYIRHEAIECIKSNYKFTN